MQPNDILMKKWCFGTGRMRKQAQMTPQGEVETVYSYPKYRTIVLKVTQATKKGNQWYVDAQQYSSLTGKPKNVKLVLNEKKVTDKLSYYQVPEQKRPFLLMENPGMLTDKGIPPVGSLITVNKKHAIVTAVGRNELTVWVNNKLETIVCKPGTVKWHSDKILKNAVGA